MTLGEFRKLTASMADDATLHYRDMDFGGVLTAPGFDNDSIEIDPKLNRVLISCPPWEPMEW